MAMHSDRCRSHDRPCVTVNHRSCERRDISLPSSANGISAPSRFGIGRRVVVSTISMGLRAAVKLITGKRRWKYIHTQIRRQFSTCTTAKPSRLNLRHSPITHTQARCQQDCPLRLRRRTRAWRQNLMNFCMVLNVSGELFDRKANEIIETYATTHLMNEANSASDSWKPFFIYYATPLIHKPWQAPQSYLDRCKVCSGYNYTQNGTSDWCSVNGEEPWRVYCAMVAMVDSSVANVTCTLRRFGMWNETLFVFLSDNGALATPPYRTGSSWPLRGQKKELWEGSMRNVAFVCGELVPTAARGATYVFVERRTGFGDSRQPDKR